MANNSNVVINLSTGHEDFEKVTIAFLVATAALAKEKSVVMFLTKEAVRLALPGYADAIEVAGAPPVSKLFDQFAQGAGELYVCPICFEGRASSWRTARLARRRAALARLRTFGPARNGARNPRAAHPAKTATPCRVGVG